MARRPHPTGFLRVLPYNEMIVTRLPWMAGPLCVLAALVLAAPAQAASPGATTPQLIERATQERRIARDTATLYLAYALHRPAKLPRAYRSDAPWDGTLPLLHLRDAVKRMRSGPQRTEAEAITAAASTSSCSGNSTSLPNSSTNSAHFYVEYGTIGGGLTIAQYETSLDQARDTQVGSFGWAAPPTVASPPPGGRYHVRIESLGNGLYGFVSSTGTYAGLVGNNPNTSWNDGDAYASCMVLNSNYSGFPSPPQASLDSTTAHEFNHSLQFGYGALTGSNAADNDFVEGGATWMEDEVQDAANDNYFYLWPTFSDSMGEYGASPYPYWITFRGLTERYGAGAAGGAEDVMQDFWEETSKGTGNNLTAMQTALVNQGTTLADAFHAYAIAVKFNKACGGGYVYPYCFQEAAGYLSIAGATGVHHTIASVGGATPTNGNGRSRLEDNYAINWVALPASGGPYLVTLENLDTGGNLRGTVVCDTGSALSLTALPDAAVTANQSTTLSGYNPSALGCTGTPVLAITNQSQTAANPTGAQSVTQDYRVSTSGAPVVQHQLTVSLSGTGTVTSSPSGITCGADCTQLYDQGTTVTLTATPDAGWGFTGWSGEGCSGTGTCQVTMSQARSVTATFAQLPTFALNVAKAGDGSGTVISSPSGISCGADCGESYVSGTVVTLTASPSGGSGFSGWSGEGCSGTGTCQVTMSQARNVTATFAQIPSFALNVAKAGDGSGTVTSSPGGISCGTTCSASFISGTVVTLSAAAASGSSFSGWSGEGCSGTGTCQVTMSQARGITASFGLVPSGGGGTTTTTTTTNTSSPITGPLTATPLDGTAPSLTLLRLRPTRFRVPGGTTVRYSLSEAAGVDFRVERALTGRRVGARCVRATTVNRARVRCLRWVRLRGRFTQSGRAGANSRRFSGRLAGVALRLGRHRLVALYRDGAGNVGVARRAAFTIVR